MDNWLPDNSVTGQAFKLKSPQKQTRQEVAFDPHKH
jgi:hypothetical protein